ncbi:MAG: serine hydrolase domain-containing protein [Alphaproteobacteria bacterium]|jgi:CubicO group peptidase (beta-lactamase class C family)
MKIIRLCGALALGALVAGFATPAQAEDDLYPVGTISSMWWPQNMIGSYRHWDEIFAVREISRGDGLVFPLIEGEVFEVYDFDYRGGRRLVADYMEDNRVTGLLVLHGGLIRMERYAYGADETSLSTSQSVAKSIVSTLVGRAIHDGLIESVDEPIDRYVPALAQTGYAGVPIEAVLQMSSGIRYNEDYDDPNSDVSLMWAQAAERHTRPINDFLLDYRAQRAPGTVYNYKGADTQALAWMLMEVTGMNLADYASAALWQPLGMEADASWMVDGRGDDAVEIAFTGVNARLRDYGRFGLLMAQDGMWEDQRLLPEGWVQQATVPSTPQVQPGELYQGYPLGYQYQWWTLPWGDGVFTAQGVNGQFVYVDPANDLVVVQTAVWRDWWVDEAEEEFYALARSLTEVLSHQ